MICLCGHREGQHYENEVIKGMNYCTGCTTATNEGIYIIMGHEFKLDNLRYLEQKSLEKESK